MLPGCEYNSANVSSAQMDDRLLVAVQSVHKEIKVFQRDINAVRYGRVIHDVESGTCGGTYTKEGTHENGIEDLTYTYDHYCTGDAMKQTIIDGVTKVHKDQTPTPSGPELNSMTIETQGDGITTTQKADGKSTSQTTAMNGVVYTPGKNGAPNKLEVETLKSTNSEGKVFELTDADIESKDAEGGQPATFRIKKANYKDPDVGLVSIETTEIPYGDGAAGKPASITVSGSEGTVEFKTNDSSTGRFSATMDGKTVGALDCSKNL
jgi:hypothetical protein